MFLLFIFESIGTSELILIGIIALIFLGPRKLPQIARTVGKTMADLRNTTQEFRSTWEREVNFEEEARAIRTGEMGDTPTVSPTPPIAEAPDAPAIKTIDTSAFDRAGGASEPENDPEENDLQPLSDKRTWL
jgi:Tat protein translocase TatB subunit